MKAMVRLRSEDQLTKPGAIGKEFAGADLVKMGMKWLRARLMDCIYVVPCS